MNEPTTHLMSEKLLHQATEIAQPLTFATALLRAPVPIQPKYVPLPSAFPAPMNPAAFHGLAGEIVHCLSPETEASLEALLGQLIVCFGNALDRTAHRLADGATHYMNEFLLLVGDTAQGGKGGSLARIENIVKQLESVREVVNCSCQAVPDLQDRRRFQ